VVIKSLAFALIVTAVTPLCAAETVLRPEPLVLGPSEIASKTHSEMSVSTCNREPHCPKLCVLREATVSRLPSSFDNNVRPRS
jgi:hypothetical protein